MRLPHDHTNFGIGTLSPIVQAVVWPISRQHDQFSSPAWTMAWRTAALVLSATGTIGSRTVSEHLPSTESAYFTGAGLVSRNKAVCSGISCACSLRAVW